MVLCCVLRGEAALSWGLSGWLESNCVQRMGLHASSEPSASMVATSSVACPGLMV